MARRIKSRKRRHLGNRTFGAGNTKNRRGKGNKGGKGRAGWHKHKWLQTIKLGLHKSRKIGFFSPQKKLVEHHLGEISKQISLGKWPQENGFYKIDLGHAGKVIATGEINFPAEVKAGAFSEGAAKKIEKAGGRVIAGFPSKKESSASADANKGE